MMMAFPEYFMILAFCKAIFAAGRAIRQVGEEARPVAEMLTVGRRA